MASWFSCEIVLDLPSKENEYHIIAKYPSDPGFQLREEVKVIDASLTKTENEQGERTRNSNVQRFDFSAMVTKREKIIEVDKEVDGVVLDTCTLVIHLEIADKEKYPDLIRIIEELN